MFNPDKQVNLQEINNKLIPYYTLSMYYNDMITYNEAGNKSLHSSVINTFLTYNFIFLLDFLFSNKLFGGVFGINNIPENIIRPIADKTHLYIHIPECNFISLGIYNKPIVSDIYAWGNRQTMAIYCNTYNYVINKIKLYNGNYIVHGESSLTDNIYENNVEHSFHYYGYTLDKYRRMFDNIVDSRYVDIKKYDISTFDVVIPSQPQ